MAELGAPEVDPGRSARLKRSSTAESADFHGEARQPRSPRLQRLETERRTPVSDVLGLQATIGNKAVGQLLQRRAASSLAVQRYREFDKVAGTKDYANGGKGIDGADDTYHYSMNPRGPASPVASHFDEVHVTFDVDSGGDDLDWDAKPHFYYSDASNPKFIPKDDTAANRRFREDHAVEDKFGESDDGWGEYELLKKRSKPLVESLIPRLPVYEGATIPEVQQVHAARLLQQQKEAAEKQAAEEAAAAEIAADSEAEKSGKMGLKITYDNSRHKKADVQSWADTLKARTNAATAVGQKAQGRGASLCTVLLGFTAFVAAREAKELVGTAKEPGKGEELTVTFI